MITYKYTYMFAYTRTKAYTYTYSQTPSYVIGALSISRYGSAYMYT